ncbi:MAG TPA: hypothetical protein VIH61_07315 [Waddliaceae bacterium]
MIYKHPISGQEIEGIRVGPGTKLIPADQYDSTDGKWRPVPCPDAVIQVGCRTVIVRPTSAIKSDQRWSITATRYRSRMPY